MRVVRLSLLGVIVASVVVLVGGSARAGGATWDFNGKQHYEIAFVAGDTVEASTSVWISAPDLGRPDDGPFHGYLVRPTEEGPWPPPVPDDAIYLGEITIEEHTEHLGTARLTFTVPDVEPGDYSLLHCNDPCTTSLGDIMTTRFTVAATQGEGELLVETRQLEQRADEYLFRIKRLEQALKDHKEERHGAKIEALHDEVSKLAAQVEALGERPESRVLEGSLGAGAALTASGAAWWALRRRKNL